MLTINDIKETCIEVDLQNLNETEKEVRNFYSQINLKELLKIYSSYCGLDDYSKEEHNNYLKYYNIDILELINNL